MAENEKNCAHKFKSWDVESIIGSLFFIIVFIIVVLQVFCREIVYFSYVLDIDLSFNPPVWTEEGARWAWIWMVFIMWGRLERSGGQLKAGFLDNYADKRPLKIIMVVLDCLYLCLIGFLFVRGVLQAIKGMETRPITLPFVDAFLYIVLPFSLLFVLPQVVKRIVKGIKNINQLEKGRGV